MFRFIKFKELKTSRTFYSFLAFYFLLFTHFAPSSDFLLITSEINMQSNFMRLIITILDNFVEHFTFQLLLKSLQFQAIERVN